MQQQQNDDNGDQHSDAAGGIVAPVAAVRPSGQRTEQYQDENNNQDCAEHILTRVCELWIAGSFWRRPPAMRGLIQAAGGHVGWLADGVAGDNEFHAAILLASAGVAVGGDR